MNSLRVTLSVLLLMVTVAAGAQVSHAESTTQWPGYVVSYCAGSITLQLDRDMNTSLRKGTIITLAVTRQTQVEGNTQWPSATVEFVPSTKLATRIWFRPPGHGTPQVREDSGCRGTQPGTASPGPNANTQAVQTVPGSQFEKCTHIQPELMIQRAAAGDALGEFCSAYYSIEGAAGITQNVPEGVRRMRHAAEMGYAPAQREMGNLYRRGYGVPQDDRQAEAWYQKGAAQGYAPAQTDLADLYMTGGNGVRKDDNLARKWANLAAEQNYAPAFNVLAKIKQGGQGQRAEPAQDLFDQGARVYRAGDQAGAAKYFLSAAQAGHVGAQLQIGWHYEKGIGVPRSYAEAARWYRKSAEQGNATAMKNLGTLYEEGWGVPEDWIEAAKWYQKSADLGNADGESALARAYEFGIGVPQNRKTTILWDERAAAQGNGQSAHYARWLRDPTNNIGFRNQNEHDLVMAGQLRFGAALIGGDPAGILFRNSNERLGWLLTQRKTLDRQEAETIWQIQKSEYDRCRNAGRDNCHEPGPRP